MIINDDLAKSMIINDDLAKSMMHGLTKILNQC